MSETTKKTKCQEPGSYPNGITEAEAHVMMITVLKIFQRWNVSDVQACILLGAPSTRTFHLWKAGDTRFMPSDIIWRLGDILGIHKAVRSMFVAPERGYEWIKLSNMAFGGKSALDRMLAGTPSDITAVRSYLDAGRGGW